MERELCILIPTPQAVIGLKSKNRSSQESGNRNTISQPKRWDRHGLLLLCHMHLAFVSTCDPISAVSTTDDPLKTLVSKCLSPQKQHPNAFLGSRGNWTETRQFSFRQCVILETEAVPVIPKTAWSSYLYPGVLLKHQDTRNSKSLAYLPPGTESGTCCCPVSLQLLGEFRMKQGGTQWSGVFVGEGGSSSRLYLSRYPASAAVLLEMTPCFVGASHSNSCHCSRRVCQPESRSAE